MQRLLVIPPAAQRDRAAIQMLSTWIAEQGMHCTINIGHFAAQGLDESRSWGVLLADLARHVASAWEAERGASREGTLASIVQAMGAELESPTSPIAGTFHPGHS